MKRPTRNYFQYLILYALLWKATGMAFYVLTPRNKCPHGFSYGEVRIATTNAQCNVLQGEFIDNNCYFLLCVVDKVLRGGIYISRKGQCGDKMTTSIPKIHMRLEGCYDLGYRNRPAAWGDCYNMEFCQAGDGQYDDHLLAIPHHYSSCPGGIRRIVYGILITKFEDCKRFRGGHHNDPSNGWIRCHLNFCLLGQYKNLWGSSAYPVGSSWTDMTKGAALVGHTSETVSMSSCTLCVMKCWYHRDCLSVNCGKEGSMEEYQCQLNTANRDYPSATSLVPHSYLSYYDIVYEGKEFA